MENLQNNALFQFYIDGDHPMSEDCLNVNVFTPLLPSSKSTPLPVSIEAFRLEYSSGRYIVAMPLVDLLVVHLSEWTFDRKRI